MTVHMLGVISVGAVIVATADILSRRKPMLAVAIAFTGGIFWGDILFGLLRK